MCGTAYCVHQHTYVPRSGSVDPSSLYAGEPGQRRPYTRPLLLPLLPPSPSLWAARLSRLPSCCGSYETLSSCGPHHRPRCSHRHRHCHRHRRGGQSTPAQRRRGGQAKPRAWHTVGKRERGSEGKNRRQETRGRYTSQRRWLLQGTPGTHLCLQQYDKKHSGTLQRGVRHSS